MTDREIFSGFALNAIDAKGRVSIPADFRTVMEANIAGRSLVLATHPVSPCINGYDQAWAKALRAEIAQDEAAARVDGKDFDRLNTKRGAFGATVTLPYDSSGRFILPGFFRQKASLEDWAFFYSAGDVFEIWNPRLLVTMTDVHPDMIEIVRYEMAEKGLK